MSQEALDLECDNCDGTGYENLYSSRQISAYYTPGAKKRWSYEAGQVSYMGDASIKVDKSYESLMERATYITFGGIQWEPSIYREPGAAMGQRRLVYTLARKD
jgi:hypothetical protein